MKYIDENGEEKAINIKDVAKNSLKKQMTVNAKRMMDESNDVLKKSVANKVKTTAISTTKEFIKPKYHNSEEQSIESKAANNLVDGSKISIVKYAKKTGKKVRNIQYTSRELKVINKYEKFISKAQKKASPVSSGSINKTTTIKVFQKRATQRRLFKQITGKKYTGKTKNLEPTLQNAIVNFFPKDFAILILKKKISITLAAISFFAPVLFIILVIVTTANPLKYLAEHESDRITLQSATVDVDYAYQSDLQRLKFYYESLVDEGYYPRLCGGTTVNWKDVISIYYCIEKRTDSSPFVFTEDKICNLIDITYEMYPIHFYQSGSEPYNVTLNFGYQGNSEICGINVTYLTAEEMMNIYDFSESEISLYNSLIDPENNQYWNKILSTVTQNANPMINLGLSQLGNTGEFYVEHTNFYGSWISDHDTPWCATFISWLVKECEYTEILPQSASVSDFVNYFSREYPERLHIVSENTGSLKVESDYIPQVGDIVIYGLKSENYTSSNTWWRGDHIGIVTEVDEQSETITVLEGNCSGEVKTTFRTFYQNWISAYCTPAYPLNLEVTTIPELDFENIKDIQTFNYGPNYVKLLGEDLNPNVNELQVLMKNYNTNNKYKYNAYCVVEDYVKVSLYGIDSTTTPAEIIMPDGSSEYMYIGYTGYTYYKNKYRHYTYFCLGSDCNSKDTVYALFVDEQ